MAISDSRQPKKSTGDSFSSHIGAKAAIGGSGAVVGAILAGPVGALVGAALGTAFGAVADAEPSQKKTAVPSVALKTAKPAKTKPKAKTRKIPAHRARRHPQRKKSPAHASVHHKA